jgi:hypothetical protein
MLRAIVLVSLISTTTAGCATHATVSPEFQPSADRGLVFGRVNVRCQGGAGLNIHVSAYEGDSTLASLADGWATAVGDYYVNADDQGYFAMELPPGKYLFVRFGIGSEMVLPYSKKWGTVHTFTAEANRAVYVGDIEANARVENQLVDDPTCESGRLRVDGLCVEHAGRPHLMRPGVCVPDDEVHVTSRYEEARRSFHKTHPRAGDLVDRAPRAPEAPPPVPATSSPTSDAPDDTAPAEGKAPPSATEPDPISPEN